MGDSDVDIPNQDDPLGIMSDSEPESDASVTPSEIERELGPE